MKKPPLWLLVLVRNFQIFVISAPLATFMAMHAGPTLSVIGGTFLAVHGVWTFSALIGALPAIQWREIS